MVQLIFPNSADWGLVTLASPSQQRYIPTMLLQELTSDLEPSVLGPTHLMAEGRSTGPGVGKAHSTSLLSFSSRHFLLQSS